MRFVFGVEVPLLWLSVLCVVGVCQAGLAHRRLRETAPAGQPLILSETIATDLRKDQIPVVVIQDAVIADLGAVVNADAAKEPQLADKKELKLDASAQLVEPAPVAVADDVETVEAVAAGAEQIPEIVATPVDVAQAQPVDEALPHERQATQPTPTGSTTQQNFVQLIQNSPIGQFFNQLTGQQQQQQQQQDATADAATPAPTIPGFLNPQTAITSAQQAVQNAAQSVVNTTTQAFQGLTQFATNLGTQFQNTLSSFGGQQNQLSTADSTTTRPPGPIQSVINNFIGGNVNQSAAPAAGQPQNPLQGIISFFQGGNRPNTDAAAAAPATSTDVKPNADASIAEKPTRLDDKIDENNEITEQQQNELDSINEVRSSHEISDDSFEEIKPEDVIVVNDDASEQEAV